MVDVDLNARIKQRISSIFELLRVWSGYDTLCKISYILSKLQEDLIVINTDNVGVIEVITSAVRYDGYRCVVSAISGMYRVVISCLEMVLKDMLRDIRAKSDFDFHIKAVNAIVVVQDMCDICCEILKIAQDKYESAFDGSIEHHISQYNNAYHMLNDPIVDDAEYDEMKVKAECILRARDLLQEVTDAMRVVRDDFGILRKELGNLQLDASQQKLVSFENALSQVIQRTEVYKNDAHKHDVFQDAMKYSGYLGNVGVAVDDRFRKIKHSRMMGSLHNIDDDSIGAFFRRFLYGKPVLELWCELKIDGVAFSAIYVNGMLQHATTRGDGEYGEDITANILRVIHFPKLIDSPIATWMEVRGEVYINHDTFLKLEGFVNPRNATAGSLRQLDASVTAMRGLRYFAYALFLESPKLDVEQLATQERTVDWLREMGFCTPPMSRLVTISTEEKSAFKQVQEYYDDMLLQRSDLEFDIDGIVIKVNDIAEHYEHGYVGREPRWAAAKKFPPATGVTTVLAIVLQVGRTGVITPVAELKPINIGGVLIKRATLHNFDEIKRKNIGIGSLVEVCRAGDVIPYIVRNMSEHDAPVSIGELCSKCPSCGGNLVFDGIMLKCCNKFACKAQLIGYLKHLVSRTAFNIVGLGEQKIEFLFDKGLINSPASLFKLRENLEKSDIVLNDMSGWGDTSVDNLFASIEAARNIEFKKLIFALGINSVGIVTAELLAKHYIRFEDWFLAMQKLGKDDVDVVNEVCKLKGIGESTVHCMKNFFADERNIEMVRDLASCIFIQGEVIDTDYAKSPLTGKTIVFTGSMKMKRNEAALLATRLGAKVNSSVSIKTDILVVGENGGNKLRDADKHGIQIISEDEWYKILSDANIEVPLLS